MSTQNNENNCELKNNPLKQRIEKLMTPEELKKPYAFATRIGLSKGTFTGIWKDGRDSLHKSTIDKICAATGANAAWLATGIGEVFLDDKIKQNTPNKNKSLNIKKLSKAIETADNALAVTNSSMTTEKYSQFVSTLYATEQSDIDSQKLLMTCVELIEEALKVTRRTMSSSSKSELILIIYNFYIEQTWTREMIKSALQQLIDSINE